MAEVKNLEPKFRMSIMDMETKKIRIITIYDTKIGLDDLKNKMVEKIKEIK